MLILYTLIIFGHISFLPSACIFLCLSRKKKKLLLVDPNHLYPWKVTTSLPVDPFVESCPPTFRFLRTARIFHSCENIGFPCEHFMSSVKRQHWGARGTPRRPGECWLPRWPFLCWWLSGLYALSRPAPALQGSAARWRSPWIADERGLPSDIYNC